MGSSETDIKELEKYLSNKLESAIGEAKEADKLSSCLFKLDGYFTALKRHVDGLPDESIYKREKIYQLSNLLSEWEMITKKHGFQYPEGLYAAYELKKKLKKLKKDFHKATGDSPYQKPGQKNKDVDSISGQPFGKKQELEQSGEESGPDQDFHENLSEHRWSSRYRPEKVFGLEEKIRFMERLIVRKESPVGFKTMAIVGIPGVGKTTICQVMYNHEPVKEHFDIRLWVCLSRQKEDDPDRRKEVIKSILACLGNEEKVVHKIGEGDEGLHKLLIALQLQLLGKRYLIILDDASSKDDASSDSRNDQTFLENLSSNSSKYENKMAYGLPKGGGSMVIVTTRSEELANKMVGEDHVHHLPLLKNKELCWDIFKANLESDGTPFPEELEDLRKLVIKKCAGLPLSASMMGEIMRERILEDAKKTAKKKAREEENKRENQAKDLRQVKSGPL